MPTSSSDSACTVARVSKYVVEDLKSIKLEPSAEVASSRHCCLFTCFFCDAQFNEKTVLQRHQENCRLRHSTLRTVFVRTSEQNSNKADHFRNVGLVSATRPDNADMPGLCKDSYTALIVVVDSDDEENCPPPDTHHVRSRQKCVALRQKSRWSLARPQRSAETHVQKLCRNDNLGVESSRSLSRLLSVDLCSPLGELIQRHIDVSSSVCATEGRVINCSTDAVATGLADEDRHNELDCACGRGDRVRHSNGSFLQRFPVTFRRSRRGYYAKFCHKYKYTREQRRTFCENYDSGLNSRSRNLLRLMKQCGVQMARLPIDSVLNQNGCQDSKGRDRAAFASAESHFSLSQNYHVQQIATPLPSDSMNAETIDKPSQQSLSLFSAATDIRSDTLGQNIPPNLNCFVLLDDCFRFKGNRSSQELSSELPDIDLDVVTTVGTDEICNVNDSSLCGTTGLTAQDNDGAAEESSRSSASDTNLLCTSGFADHAAELLAYDDLPSLSFLCYICNNVIDCNRDSKAMISEHYAEHDMANVDLVRITLPSGEMILKLVEVPVPKIVNTSVPLFDEITPAHTRGILVKETRVRGHQQESSRPHRKRKRVTWADETEEGKTVSSDKRARLELVQEFDHFDSELHIDRREHVTMATTTLVTHLSFYNKPARASLSPAFVERCERPKHTTTDDCPDHHHHLLSGDLYTPKNVDPEYVSKGNKRFTSVISQKLQSVTHATTLGTRNNVSWLPYDILRDSLIDRSFRDDNRVPQNSLASNDTFDISFLQQQHLTNRRVTTGRDFVPMTFLPCQPPLTPDYDVICLD